MLSLSYQPDELECDLVDPADARDADLVTEILIALLSDARAEPGELPEGVGNRGFWADALEPSGEQTGSRLWLLEHAAATLDNAERAERYASEALAYLGRDKRARTVTTEALIDGEVLALRVIVDGLERARVRVN